MDWSKRDWIFCVILAVITMLAYHNLGAALARIGRTSDAIAEFKATLRINPGYIGARNNLAKLEALQNSTPAKIDKTR